MNATFPNTADPSAGAMQPTQPPTAPPDAPGFVNPYGRWHGAFVPLWLLERGEIPTGAKMTYAVLCYHAGRQGRCFPGQRVLARELAISERQVRANLTTLVAHGMISVVQRGLRRSNVYHFCVHPWQSLARQRRDQPEEVRQPAAVPEQTPRSALERNLSAGPVGTMDMEAESMEHVPACPSTGEGEGVRSLPSSDLVETIYAAYPCQVGKPAALRAIRGALRSHAADFLLERTQLFARTYRGDPRFIPHPANWFRDERFSDPPSTWTAHSHSRPGPAPLIVQSGTFGCGATQL